MIMKGWCGAHTGNAQVGEVIVSGVGGCGVGRYVLFLLPMLSICGTR